MTHDSTLGCVPEHVTAFGSLQIHGRSCGVRQSRPPPGGSGPVWNLIPRIRTVHVMRVVVGMFSKHQHLIEEFLGPFRTVLRCIADQSRGRHHAVVQPRRHAAHAATVGRVVSRAVVSAQSLVEVGRPPCQTRRGTSGHVRDRNDAGVNPTRCQERHGTVLAQRFSGIDRREWRCPRRWHWFDRCSAAGPRLTHSALHLALCCVFEAEGAIRRSSKHRAGQDAVGVHFNHRAHFGHGAGPRRPRGEVNEIRHHDRGLLSKVEKDRLTMAVSCDMQNVLHVELPGAMCHVGGPFEQKAMMAVGRVGVALIDALVDQQGQAEVLCHGAGDVEGRVFVQTQRGTHPVKDEDRCCGGRAMMPDAALVEVRR